LTAGLGPARPTLLAAKSTTLEPLMKVVDLIKTFSEHLKSLEQSQRLSRKTRNTFEVAVLKRRFRAGSIGRGLEGKLKWN